jgi:hypothetical protein
MLHIHPLCNNDDETRVTSNDLKANLFRDGPAGDPKARISVRNCWNSDVGYEPRP